MFQRFFSTRWHHHLIALGMAGALAWASPAVQAQSQASAALSVVPLASAMVVGASLGGSEGAVALPFYLSEGVSELVVQGVSATAEGVSYATQQVSDGASVVLEISGNAVGALSVGVGTVIQASATGTGMLISAAGEVLAFIPNAVGASLLHSERL